MHVFEMIVIIACVSILGGIIKQYLARNQVVDTDLQEISARLTNLESLQHRIETLEAIVTDKGYDLKSKIDNL